MNMKTTFKNATGREGCAGIAAIRKRNCAGLHRKGDEKVLGR